MTPGRAGFPKSARLITKRDYRFHPFARHQSENFTFFFTREGSARIGVSLSKKVLKEAASRNRVRRLLREAFRRNRCKFEGVDVHVVGRPRLTHRWRELGFGDVLGDLNRFLEAVGRRER